MLDEAELDGGDGYELIVADHLFIKSPNLRDLLDDADLAEKLERKFERDPSMRAEDWRCKALLDKAVGDEGEEPWHVRLENHIEQLEEMIGKVVNGHYEDSDIRQVLCEFMDEADDPLKDR